jgi:potassium efflux system protein
LESQAQSETSAGPVSREEIRQQIESISAQTDLAEQEKTDLLAQLQQALEELDLHEQHEAKIAELTKQVENAPGEIARYEQLLEETPGDPQEIAADIPEGATVEEIESQLTLLRAERQRLAERRDTLLGQIDKQQERSTAIKSRLAELQTRIEETEGKLQMPADTEAKRVQRSLLSARLQAWQSEVRSLETEVLSQPTLAQVDSVERAWLQRKLARIDIRLAALASAAETARASDTAEKITTTETLAAELGGGDSTMRAFVDRNRELAEQLQSVAAETERARRDAARLQDQLTYIEQDSNLMSRRLDVAGRKEILGRVMITRLDSLPDVPANRREINQRNALIATSSMAYIDIDEEFRALADLPQYIAQQIPDFGSRSPEQRQVIQKLIDQRTELLQDNLQAHSALLTLLVDTNVTANKLVKTTVEYHEFLMGNLMWVRDFSFMDPRLLYQQLRELFSLKTWAAFPHTLLNGFRQAPLAPGLLLGYLLLIPLLRQLRRPYRELMSRPMPLSADSVLNILVGLAVSMLRVLPWPLALLLTGHFLIAADSDNPALSALGPALIRAAQLLYVLLLARLLISKHGAGRRMLKWDARELDALRRELNWAGPLVVLAGLFNVYGSEVYKLASGGPLGALAVAVAAGSVSVVSIRLLRNTLFRDNAFQMWVIRLAALLGTAVIALELLGLLFASKVYLSALGTSLLLLLLVKVIVDTLQRWLLILRAQLERRKREERRALQDEGQEPLAVSDDQLDSLSLSTAHTKLLDLVRVVAVAAVLWLVWSPSLPAFNLLDSVTLWEVADSGAPDGSTRAITLFDLLLSVIILVVTALVAKHLPSLLQVFLQEWGKISAGARYATGILMQYLVIAIGGSMFLTTIGWEWSKVQWLVAALGVGIGFGLQEIVANFISGIIILFERPIRVGDIITAGGAEGVVKKINPRATIIETFERKEHLIPNKELITGQVINWSLSDSLVRVVIPVGIAYGSDVRRAMALLLEAARELPSVMTDPEPRVSFEDFGDNALVLWLRCFVAEDRVGAWTNLRTVIYEKFEAAGIVISFPQRDVHLDVMHPLRIEIERPPSGDDKGPS